MLTIEMQPQAVHLGQQCSFLVRAKQEGVEVRYFVRHRGILYLKPLTDWTKPGTFHFFPEAPGDYSLLIEWRTQEGQTDLDTFDFAVEAGETRNDGPQKVRVDRMTEVWVSSRWEAKLLAGYEEPVVRFMRNTIAPGWAVYDIGANIGLYSILAGRLVGEQGRVYSVEANPLCVYLLRTNLELNQISNSQILPMAALDRAGSVNFTLNYGNLGLGVTQRSSLYATKAGHEIGVAGLDMTSMIAQFGLRSPDLIKIDVEGAEGFVIEGLASIIQNRRPCLMIEVHGKVAAGQTFQHFRDQPYRYEILNDGQKFATVDALLDWFPESVWQVACLPK